MLVDPFPSLLNPFDVRVVPLKHDLILPLSPSAILAIQSVQVRLSSEATFSPYSYFSALVVGIGFLRGELLLQLAFLEYLVHLTHILDSDKVSPFVDMSFSLHISQAPKGASVPRINRVLVFQLTH